jgi:valyl-tRNA synthetase
MHKRYEDWTRNLNSDWCVSRQRYFGVPIPVWYPLDANGERDYARPILPDAASLPVDPTTDLPPGYRAEQREQPGGFSAETDIFDTWFTSSLTPQISSHWGTDPERTRRCSRPTCASRARTSSAPGRSTRSRRRCCTRTRCRGATSRCRASSPTPTARRCRRARAT